MSKRKIRASTLLVAYALATPVLAHPTAEQETAGTLPSPALESGGGAATVPVSDTTIDPSPTASAAASSAPALSTELSNELVAAGEAAVVADQGSEVIEIDDSAPAESASSVHLTDKDLSYRSRTQISDILRQVPGLMVSQHAGGGKSDQYFIRGFDADHGTDIVVFADGIPVNFPSHGHGQGYADTHFLIPETIAAVDVHKGPYSARFGDFYTAGALELKTRDSVDGPTLWISGGAPLAGPKRWRHYNQRLVGMASPHLRGDETDRALIAVQVANNDGPFENPQEFRQGNALVKWRGDVGRGELRFETNWYAATWNASGQIPESAVVAGTIGRFGSLDPTEGGNTSRSSAQVGYSIRDGRGGTWRASAFLMEYRLRLFSNFTLFARDPMNGDQIEQTDARTVWGLDAAYDRRLSLGHMDSIITAGVQVRNDDVDTELSHSARRKRLSDCFSSGANPCNHTFDRIRNVAGYVETNVHVLPHVHVLPGLRFEHFVWDVEDLDAKTQNDPAATTGGSVGRAMVLPKLSLEIEATKYLNLFVNSGSGFHSNDARSNVATKGSGALARAFGAEAGFRTTILPRARIAADLWYLRLASELVWNGDSGGTEASDPTQRYGADIEVAYHPTPWLRIDGTLSAAHATLTRNPGNNNAVALAPRLMGQGGVTITRGPQFLSLRARGLGDRPGNSDRSLTAKGYLIFDLVAGLTFGKLDLNVTVNNLLNSDWSEAQFADASRVTPTADVVEQMHVTPGIPLTATATAAYRF
jgi:hypothetical protein